MHTLTPVPTLPHSRFDRLLQCLSSGYLSDGCSCRATVPTSVANAAWARELNRGTREDRIFGFVWRGGEWRAYGLRDGRVRGVYCPEHSARRAARTCDERADLDIAS